MTNNEAPGPGQRPEPQGAGSPSRLQPALARVQTPVDVFINELVLHGFAPRDRHHITLAVERELARLITTHGLPRSLALGGTRMQLDGGAFDAIQGTGGRTIGEQVARAIYRGLAA